MEKKVASDTTPKCLVCERSSDIIPLVTLDYHGTHFRICPQHLPILIHDPRRLIGRLPGAEKFSPAEHEE